MSEMYADAEVNVTATWKTNFEYFVFQWINYAETPNFPQLEENSLFYYPFTVAKTIVNTFNADISATSYDVNMFYMKKSFVCLESLLLSQI